MKAYIHAYVVTCDQDFRVYEDGMVLVEGESLAYVGPFEEERLAACEEVVDYQGQWILPGLVNTHVHTAMTLLRGIEDDSKLHDWLEQHVWPAEADFTPAITNLAVQVALSEMLLSGTTTFNDMYNPSGVAIEEVYQLVERSGMRAFFSPTLFSSEQETTEETLARTRTVLEQIAAFDNPRFQAMVAPHSPYACERDLLKGALVLAQDLDLPIHIHVAETQEESQILLERTGKRPMAYLQELGYLDHPGIFAHGLELTDEEIAELAAAPIAIAHNPISNLKLASGVARVTDLLEAGVTVGLATDSVASNNNLDLFEETRTAALLQKMRRGDARDFPIQQALRAMTIEGAKALGMEDQIGSLEPGKQADFIVIDPRRKHHLQPVQKVLSHLVYAAKGSDVSQVYIAGQQVVRDGRVLTLDQDTIFEKLHHIDL